MIGIIERLKNNVLLKCSTLNENIINNKLSEIIDTSIYRFAEEIISMLSDLNFSEEEIRIKTSELLKGQIIKKVKRKLFVDSLALQITNDSYIESYVNKEIGLDSLKKKYIKELNVNKNSNQLNMTEDLDLTEIYEKLNIYFNANIIPVLIENKFLANAIKMKLEELKNELEKKLESLIKETDIEYLNILVNELEFELDNKEEEYKGEDDNMYSVTEEVVENIPNEIITKTSKFEKYDDMTLFNKTILCLNTEEEKLTRKEAKLEARKKEVEQRLSATNKNIEANIERENKLSQRRIELNSREVELNAKLSEAEVIFLNMKPLIKGLNKIKSFDNNGGGLDE